MATKKRACIKRGRHNKCLKRAGSARRGGGRRRVCRKANGQIKRCSRRGRR